MFPLRCLCSSLVCALSLACSLDPDAQNAVADWDANTLNAVVTTAKKAPAVAPVYFAYVSVAMFDAANSIDRRHRPLACRFLHREARRLTRQ